MQDGLGSCMVCGAVSVAALGHGFLAGIFPTDDASHWKISAFPLEGDCVCACRV